MDASIAAVIKKHWNVIKTSTKRGRIVDRYHFYLNDGNRVSSNILSFVEQIFTEQNKPFKVNVAFGMILKNFKTDVLRFFHPSNNNRIFERPMLIDSNNTTSPKDLADMLNPETIADFAVVSRPSSEWLLEQIVCIEFVVTKL